MALKSTRWRLTVTFTEAVLGSQPQKDVATEFIHAKARAKNPELDLQDEVETLDEALERGTTAFHHRNGAPVIFNYIPKAFLKEAGRLFGKAMGYTGLRAKIEDFVFVEPREIPLILPEGGGADYLERPLRANTPAGPCVALVRSERLPAGTRFECDLKVYDGFGIDEDLLRTLLEYGADCGIGQWRNASYGSFRYALEKLG